MTLVRIVGLLLTVCSVVTLAQAESETVPSDIGTERARIDGIRQQKSAELDREDAACLSRFAVTDCQNKVGVRRRQMLVDLKGQEASLNTLERGQRRAEQLLLGEQKMVDSTQRQQEAKAVAEKNQAVDRQKILDDKRRNHQEQAQPVSRKTPVPKSSALQDASVVKKNREAYLEKQKSLEKRRQVRDQRLLDHGKVAAPLPVLP